MTDGRDPERSRKLDELMRGIGYRFKRVELLDQAFTHGSFKAEMPDAKDYQRLEFLGDAVLDYIVTLRLVEEHDEAGEDELTDKRIELVKNDFLNHAGDRLGILDYVLMGRSMRTNAQEPRKLAADVMEALIGAIFVDGGERHARAFIERFVLEEGELMNTPYRPTSFVKTLRGWLRPSRDR